MYKPNGVASALPGADYLLRTAAFAVVMLAAMTLFLFAGTKEAQAQVVEDVDVAEGNDVTVDVGDVDVGEEVVREVRIFNDGTENISVGGFDLLGDGAGAITGIRLIDEDGDVLGADSDGILDLEGLLGTLLGELLVIEPGEDAILEITVAPTTEVSGAPDPIDLDLDIFDELGPLLGDTLNTINVIGNAAPADDDDPTIGKIKPGKRTADRTPAVRATINDDNTDLAKEDIRLFFKGKPRTDFTYDQGTNRLKFKPGKLKYKRYTVRIEATDEEGQTTAKQKTFKVVKKRR
jgi:hypothetical protein